MAERRKVECTKEYCVPRLCVVCFLMTLGFLGLFIYFAVTELKPYEEAKDYISTKCIVVNKDEDAGSMTCSCGRRCIETDITCAAVYVMVPKTNATGMIKEDETVTSKHCSYGCYWKHKRSQYLSQYPGVGGEVPCYYDPRHYNHIIHTHESFYAVLVSILIPLGMSIIFMIPCCILCQCMWKDGYLNSSPEGSTSSSPFPFTRLNNAV